MKLRLSVTAATVVLLTAACAGPTEEAATDPAPAASSEPSEPSEPAATGEPADGTGTAEPAPATEAPEPTEPTRLAVTVDGAEIGPNAEEISLEVGEPLVIAFDSDRAGELHVHSKPEQYVPFAAGTSEQEIVVETPGTVEVEDHGTGAVVAILEVS